MKLFGSQFSGETKQFQIYQTPNMGQKWFCIQNLQMDLSFQEKKKTVCNFVA